MATGRARSPTRRITYGETARNYRMTDVNAFIAEDWRISPNLTLNLGVRWEYFGFPSEANGMLAVFDFPAALETGMIQDGFVFASNFDPNSVPGAAGLNLTKADSKSIVPGDYDNVMPRVGFAWTPFDQKNFVLRGGYGMFYERTTGGFANSLRQAAPVLPRAAVEQPRRLQRHPRATTPRSPSRR